MISLLQQGLPEDPYESAEAGRRTAAESAAAPEAASLIGRHIDLVVPGLGYAVPLSFSWATQGSSWLPAEIGLGA